MQNTLRIFARGSILKKFSSKTFLFSPVQAFNFSTKFDPSKKSNNAPKSVFLQYHSREHFEEERQAKEPFEAKDSTNEVESQEEIENRTLKAISSFVNSNFHSFMNYHRILRDPKKSTSVLISKLIFTTFLYQTKKARFNQIFNVSTPFYEHEEINRKDLVKYFTNEVLFFAEGNSLELSLNEYVTLLRCIEGMNQENNCNHLLMKLQCSISKKAEDKITLTDYLYLLKATTFLLIDKNYNSKILLYNLDYLSEQNNLLSACTLKQIMNIINHYEKILKQDAHTKLQQYFQKSMRNLEVELIKRIEKELAAPSTTSQGISYSILNPTTLFSILKIYRSMAMNCTKLYGLIEEGLIKALNCEHGYSIKTLIIGFKMLTSVSHGEKLLQDFCRSVESEKNVQNELETYDPAGLRLFLNCLVRHEINMVNESLKYTKEGDCSYLELEKVEKALTESKVLQRNRRTYEILSELAYENYFTAESLSECEIWEKTKIYQMLFWLQKTGRESLLKINYEEIMKLLRKEFENNQAFRPQETASSSNEFVADVTHILKKHNIPFNREHLVVMLCSDFALPEKKMLIELDGAYHFYYDDLKTSFPNSQFRNLFVILNGWRLIEVNFLQWETLRQNQTIDEYLMRHLKALEDHPEWALIKI